MNFKTIGIPTLKLFIIGTVITILLVVTNGRTAAQIVANQEKADVESRKEVLPEADDFEEKTAKLEDGTEFTYYEATNGAGFVFSASHKGYGGQVVTMTGISKDGKIEGIKLTEQSETAGLGAKWAGNDTTGQEKRGQFVGDVPDEEFKVTKDGGTIEAVAGATITSRAVTSDANDAVAMFKVVSGGAQ